ncbi:hypothetical protein HIM_00945 [Hirsutella minnesotensis 3608]|nr:hypothetical protein HIM_00945 [Hirsutella minnesotensis 3608]
MDYHFSSLIDPSTYDNDGLYSNVPLRVNQDPIAEDLGTIRAQEDWRKHVAPIGFYKGGLGPRFNFMTCTIPECLPGRLEIISYANELAFLHDDVVDNIGKTQTDEENDYMAKVLREAVATGFVRDGLTGKRYLIAKMFAMMTQIDSAAEYQAIVVFESWIEFLEKSSGRQRHVEFKALDEYLGYRVLDVGEKFWFGMVTFAMGLTIPKSEYQRCHEICYQAYVHFSLVNDLFSWDKEHAAAIANRERHTISALSVLMREHSVSLDEAKVICRQKIIEAAVEFGAVLRKIREKQDLSLDLRRYVDALQYTMSGHVVWTLNCPRYHKHAEYNKRQLDWMRNGTPQLPNEDGSIRQPN